MSTNEYTPTTEEVRWDYSNDPDWPKETYAGKEAEFDRWLAGVVADAKAEELEEAAASIPERMRMDELGLHQLDYVDQLPKLSRVMLNGATRFAERLVERATELRKVTTTKGEA